jgi:ParB family chromosome partitioning protein
MNEIAKHSIAARLSTVVPDNDLVLPTGEPQALDATGEDNVLRHILPDQHLLRIKVDRIAPARDGQARQDFNEERLAALAESLKRSGVREPIIVTPHGAEPGCFQIVAGERRWRAAQLAGLTEIPCIVDPGLVEQKDKLLAQAEENLHRENLNPVEEAAVLAQLMEARGLDAKGAGELLGMNARQARRLLQLHGTAAPIKRAVVRGVLDARIALEMVRIYNRLRREDESAAGTKALQKIERLIERYVSEAWTMRKLERFAAKLDPKTDTIQDEDGDPDDTKDKVAAVVTGRKHTPVLAKGSTTKSEAALTEMKNGRLVIDVKRVEEHRLSPQERAALIDLLEDLLFKVRRV